MLAALTRINVNRTFSTSQFVESPLEFEQLSKVVLPMLLEQEK